MRWRWLASGENDGNWLLLPYASLCTMAVGCYSFTVIPLCAGRGVLQRRIWTVPGGVSLTFSSLLVLQNGLWEMQIFGFV